MKTLKQLLESIQYIKEGAKELLAKEAEAKRSRDLESDHISHELAKHDISVKTVRGGSVHVHGGAAEVSVANLHLNRLGYGNTHKATQAGIDIGSSPSIAKSHKTGTFAGD